MSASPGKIAVIGIATIRGEQVFVLTFLQASNPDWTKHVFFAKYDESARWIDELRPAFGAQRFFFEEEHAKESAMASETEEPSNRLVTGTSA